MVSAPQGAQDGCLDLVDLEHDLRVHESKYSFAKDAQGSITLAICIRIRVMCLAVYLNNEIVADEEVNATDASNRNLLAKRNSSTEQSKLECGLASAFGQRVRPNCPSLVFDAELRDDHGEVRCGELPQMKCRFKKDEANDRSAASIRLDDRLDDTHSQSIPLQRDPGPVNAGCTRIRHRGQPLVRVPWRAQPRRTRWNAHVQDIGQIRHPQTVVSGCADARESTAHAPCSLNIQTNSRIGVPTLTHTKYFVGLGRRENRRT